MQHQALHRLAMLGLQPLYLCHLHLAPVCLFPGSPGSQSTMGLSYYPNQLLVPVHSQAKLLT